MIKILSVTDKKNSAIDRLATGVMSYMNGFDYQVIDIHPKRPSAQELANFIRLAEQADIIDYHYFRTAEMLRQLMPELKTKPSILRHFNPYSIDGDWSGYDWVIACNKSIEADLKRGYKNVLLHITINHRISLGIARGIYIILRFRGVRRTARRYVMRLYS